jgi:hypothetical protein
MACCPAHDDRSPSLAIRELEDGRVLLKCFASCEALSILSSVGMEFQDLFPPRDLRHHVKRERYPFPAADILHAIAFEALVVATTASSILAGEPLTPTDRERLVLSVWRIHAALDAGGLNHE